MGVILSNVSAVGLSAELQGYCDQNRAVIDDAGDLVGGLTAEQFNWWPTPGRWSVGECMHHLNEVVAVYIPLLRATVEDARSKGLTATGPFRYGLLTNWFVGVMEPPPRKRVQVPKKLRVPPSSTHDPAATLELFNSRHAELVDVIRGANGLDLKRAKIPSVASRLIVLSLGQWFGFLVAHDRRHVWQARQVMKEPGFPA